MEKEHLKLPRYGRIANPPTLCLTLRDKRILEAIHAYDGLLSFAQIQRMFFTGKSQVERRMMLLYQHKYVNRPNYDERRRLPEMIYWLDKRGAELVASLEGTPLKDFTWRTEPRWFQVEHDLAVNNFRLDLVEACRKDSGANLETWIPESEFWAYPDKVSYKYNDQEMKRNIRPDGFFILTTGEHRFRYMLEIDRSTEDNPRFYARRSCQDWLISAARLTKSVSVTAAGAGWW